MGLLQTIDADLLQAMKDRSEAIVSVLRGAKTAILNAEIAKRPEPLTEEDMLKVVRSEVKKRKDAVALYTQGGRPELAEKELAEIAMLEKYLPAQADEAVVRAAVAAAIAELGVSSPGDAGRVTGAAMGKLKGQSVDGAMVSAIAKEELTRLSSASA